MLENLDVFLTEVKWRRGLLSPNFASGSKTFLLLLLLLLLQLLLLLKFIYLI
jgi:hypothetical protein